MQNLYNNYAVKFDVSGIGENLPAKFKKVFRGYFPFVLKTLLCAVMLLILQALVVGAGDRFGISPKLSLIFSSLFYISIFVSLALIGNLKNQKNAEIFNEPVCKILSVRKKGEQKL
jgi:hypothetical protein